MAIEIQKTKLQPTVTSPVIPISVAVSAAVLVAIFLCVSIYLYRVGVYFIIIVIISFLKVFNSDFTETY